MENPMSWTPAQKCISFHMSDQGNGIADNVVRALIEEGFLVKERYNDAWMQVVEGLREHNRQINAGVCGLSGISIIYHRLRGAGLLK